MLNKSIIQGRITADPVLNHTQGGVAVATFTVACERDYKSNDPNDQNCDFITVVAWRNTAEFIARYFQKGRLILVDGRIQQRKYTDKNGEKRSSFEIVADHVNFCGKKESSQTATQAPQASQATSYQAAPEPQYAQPQSAPEGFAELPEDDGELPF